MPFTVIDFAALWRHEMWHLYGLKHADYPPSVLWCKPECVSHVDLTRFGDKLDVVVPKPRVAPSKEVLQRQKVANLLARRQEWAKKQRRADAAIAKIDRSLGYYARQGIEDAVVQPTRAAARAKRRKR